MIWRSSFARERSLRTVWRMNFTTSERVVSCFKSPTIWKPKRTRWTKKYVPMEIDGERYSKALEELRAALESADFGQGFGGWQPDFL